MPHGQHVFKCLFLQLMPSTNVGNTDNADNTGNVGNTGNADNTGNVGNTGNAGNVCR